MRNPSSFLGIAVDHGNITWAEFTSDPHGRPSLERYGRIGSQETDPDDKSLETPDLDALEPVFTGRNIHAKQCSLCLPANTVLARFLRLPLTDDGDRVRNLRHEAAACFPWPPEQTIRDFQSLGPPRGEEQDLLLVGCRSAPVERWVHAVQRLGPHVRQVDAAPLALANAFRYNYPDLDGANLLLDIGRDATTVLLLDRERTVFRTLSVGMGRSTTDAVRAGDAANEGAGPDSAAQPFLSRLQLQVTQVIRHCQQQHGIGAPQRLFLTGALAASPAIRDCLARKLAVPALAFNSLRRVAVAPALDPATVGSDAPWLGVVVGLALRAGLRCPFELNLMPPSVVGERKCRRLAVGAAAAVAFLLTVLTGLGLCYRNAANAKGEMLTCRQPLVDGLVRQSREAKAILGRREGALRRVTQLTAWMAMRFQWADLLSELRRVLDATEIETKRPGRHTGVWIESLAAELPEDRVPDEPAGDGPPGWPRQWRHHHQASGAHPVAAKPRVDAILLTCRAVSWRFQQPTADTELAYALIRQIQRSAWAAAGPEGVSPVGAMNHDKAGDTFTFQVRLVLKYPIEL